MWRGKRVAVIFPTYNEKDSIRAATLDVFATGLADEVIVVNNNAAQGTSEEVAGTGAREIFESQQGYGNALLCGMDHCTADLIVLSEPDGTFSGNDLIKLLAYSDDMPVVFGTRTSREFIWKGANMGLFLRWGNWAVAKMYHEPSRNEPSHGPLREGPDGVCGHRDRSPRALPLARSREAGASTVA